MQRHTHPISQTMLETGMKIENKIDVKKEDEKIIIKDLKLRLSKKVTWTEDTVDNEHMNKKKSKSKLHMIILILCSLLHFQETYYKSR